MYRNREISKSAAQQNIPQHSLFLKGNLILKLEQ
jgi:hypothetical protein